MLGRAQPRNRATAQPRNSAEARLPVPAIFLEGGGLLPDNSDRLRVVCGNYPGYGAKLLCPRGSVPDMPAPLPDDRENFRQRRGNILNHSGKLPNAPAPFPNRPDKLLNGREKPKTCKTRKNAGFFSVYSLISNS